MNGERTKKKKKSGSHRNPPGDRSGGTGMNDFPKNNPYNFIPFGPPVRFGSTSPSHKRLQGFSGTITLHLTNDTPMLVAHRVNPEDETPPKLENFKIDGKPVLPGTALKGMLRSVLEAVTNACFVIFDGERLDYRMAPHNALKLRAGRITRMPAHGQDGEIEEMDRAWIAMDGYPPDVNSIISGGPSIISLKTTASGDISGNEVWVQLQRVFRERWIRRQMRRVGPFLLVVDMSRRPTRGFRRARLKITKESIDVKKRERVFVYKAPPPTYPFGKAEVDDYNTVLAGQLEEQQKRGGFDLTEDQKLAVGALVYFLMEGRRAVRLSRVEIPRTRYDKSQADLLPQMYHKCTDPNNLCTACQLFGFVADVHSARGRITVSDAQWLSGPGEHDTFFPLKVLGEPHPTSYNFYLIDPTNPDQVRNYDGQSISDYRGRIDDRDTGAVQLRGRKFYFHHPVKDWQNYHCVHHEKFLTVRNDVKPLGPGNTFAYQVHFRNLSEIELGLLLYCLVLEDNLRHKLGLARAVGFGTVKITCQSLQLYKDGDRYNSLAAAPRDVTADLQTYINAFKAAVAQSNAENKPFDELLNIQKLNIILDPSQAPPNPSYPTDDHGQPTFEWYRDNKDKSLKPL